MLTIKVSLLHSKLASNGSRTLHFDVANNMRNRIFWRFADTHVDVNQHHMSLQYFSTIPARQLIQYFSQHLA